MIGISGVHTIPCEHRSVVVGWREQFASSYFLFYTESSPLHIGGVIVLGQLEGLENVWQDGRPDHKYILLGNFTES